MKPFDLDEAREGKDICTRSGRSARIICFDSNNDPYPIIALINDDEGREFVESFTTLGKYCEDEKHNKHSLDLFMVDDSNDTQEFNIELVLEKLQTIEEIVGIINSRIK